MKKRGISPLIATILIIGFVIILAALIMNWGLDLFGNTKEQQKKGEIDLICLNEIKPVFLKYCSNDPWIEALVDNLAEREISSSLFRIKGTIGTELVKGGGVGKFETATFNVPFDIAKVGTPQKVEFIPYVLIDGKEWACDIKKIEKDLTGCSCTSGQPTKSCGTDTGECTSGVVECSNGKWGICTAIWPSESVETSCSDIKDNDCDGLTDCDDSDCIGNEICKCTNSGATECCGCGCIAGSTCKGICKSGTKTCNGIIWSVCGGGYVGPEPTEKCGIDGLGNDINEDCDDLTDEICNCKITIPPTVRECYTGPAETMSNLPCKKGTQICPEGAWLECVGEVTPKPEEICNEPIPLDNDCDGKIDNDCTCLKSIMWGVEDLRINFFDKKISFDFNNLRTDHPEYNQPTDITKFKVKIIYNNGEIESDTTIGAGKNTKTENIKADFDFINIGFGNVNKIEISPYVGDDSCSDNIYSTTDINYYDSNGNEVDKIWKVWDDDGVQPGASIETQKVYSGGSSLKYLILGDQSLNIADGTVSLQDMDYFTFAVSGEGGNYFWFFLNGYQYSIGTYPCALPGVYGGWNALGGGLPGSNWKMVNIDLKTPKTYPCAILQDRPTASISSLLVRVSYVPNIYFDSIYFYKVY